jgi:hypothetical protein
MGLAYQRAFAASSFTSPRYFSIYHACCPHRNAARWECGEGVWKLLLFGVFSVGAGRFELATPKDRQVLPAWQFAYFLSKNTRIRA